MPRAGVKVRVTGATCKVDPAPQVELVDPFHAEEGCFEGPFRSRLASLAGETSRAHVHEVVSSSIYIGILTVGATSPQRRALGNSTSCFAANSTKFRSRQPHSHYMSSSRPHGHGPVRRSGTCHCRLAIGAGLTRALLAS